MMRVVVRPDGVQVIEAGTPEPGPGEAQLRMLLAGVCGSDTHALRGRHPNVHPPYAPGHEVVGVITAVAPDVTTVQVGRRATVEPDLPCWTCKQCRAGRQNLCEDLSFFGCGSEQGGMAETFTIDARRLHLVPDDLDDPTAALIEPLSTPVHAIRLAGGVRDRTVAILGVGTIGLLTLKVARAHGARRIVVTARSAFSRDRALSFGADAAVDATAPDAADRVRAELGESADVVFDCVAEQSTTTQALAIADKGGTVVVVGVPAGEVTVPLALLQDSQLRIQGSATYLPEDYTDAMQLLRDGVVQAKDFVTAIRPLAEAAEAFADAESGHHIKVLLKPADREVRLVAMTEDEYRPWQAEVEAHYAQSLARSGRSEQEAARVAAETYARLLPAGFATPDQHFWYAYDGDRRVGFLWITVGQGTAMVHNVAVEAGLRRRGYGRAIMLAAEAWCREHGLTRIGLNVFAYNAGARALYEQLGFAETVRTMAKDL